MSRRRVISILTAIGIILSAAILAGWLTLQSGWLQAFLRDRVVSSIERASGGRVELGGFHFDWRTLRVDIRNLIVHGTESPAEPVLLQVESIRIELQVLSFVRRDVNVASIAVERPQIYISVKPDGTTNIPQPRIKRASSSTVVEELLDLKVNKLEIADGVIGLADRRVPLNVRAQQLALLVNYRTTSQSYDIGLLSALTHFDTYRSLGALQMNAQVELARDRLAIRRLALEELSGGRSAVRAQGMLERFARPIMNLQLDGSIAIDDLADFANIHDLHSGRVQVEGVARYDETAQLSFDGKVHGDGIAVRSKSFNINGINFDSDVSATNQELVASNLHGTEHGVRFVGRAVIKHYRDFQAVGDISGVSLREIGSYLTNSPLAWTGVANGRVRVTATLLRSARDFALEANVKLSPTEGGIPVSGQVAVAYDERKNSIEFSDSSLNLPHSQVIFSGNPAADIPLKVESGNLDDLVPVLGLIETRIKPSDVPVLLENGEMRFEGILHGLLSGTQIHGDLALSRFRFLNQSWDRFHSQLGVSASGVDFPSVSIAQGGGQVAGAAFLGFDNWSLRENAPFRIHVQFKGIDISRTVAEFSTVRLPILRGIAAGSLDLNGPLVEARGSAKIDIDNLDTYGQQLNHARFEAKLAGNDLQVTNGRLEAGPALLSFSGAYQHISRNWRAGTIQLKADSNSFPLESLSAVRKFEPGLNAQVEIHMDAAARAQSGTIEPLRANGSVVLHDIAINKVPYGNVTVETVTRGQLLDATFSGNLLDSQWHGGAQLQITPGTPVKGNLGFNRINFATLRALLPTVSLPVPLEGFVQGRLGFEGPLEQPAQLRAELRLDQLELSAPLKKQAPGQAPAPDLVLRNPSPVVIEFANGAASVRSFPVSGQNTSLTISGSIPYLPQAPPINLKVDGSVNLRIFELFDPNVESSGVSTISASVGGSLRNPAVKGTLELKDGSFFLEDVSNGLSAVNGTIVFENDRATIQKMTANSGGGQLTVGGFVNFGGGQLVYHLDGNAQNVRVRYAGSISITATSTLRLSGTSNSSILSGTLTISRVVFNPNTDVGNLLASLGTPSAAAVNNADFLSGLHLDIAIDSAPNLQVSTALSRDVEAEIDLRLRGTPDHPILLGGISANQGDIRVFGTRYTINRGEVNFLNTVRIEPVLDLDLETQARGVTVNITIAGTLGRLNLNYRSDPPLQSHDIIALLTVGRAPESGANVQTVQAAGQASALQAGATTVLGQAIAPVSNRLSKLFGITNVKIDPLVQGITNTPQARLTVEQQISRDITVTYVTNLSQTSEQIFRFEWAFSRQFSVVAVRDDNGEFGIDFLYKKGFK